MRTTAVSLIAVTAWFASAASLNEADKREGLAQLERTRAGVLAATKGLSEAQWNFKPAPGRWSVAEVMEHIAITEDLIFHESAQKSLQAPAGKPDRDFKKIDQMVLGVITDRSHKATAPEPVVPKGGKPPKEWVAHFLASRKRTIDLLKSTPDLREHVLDSPIGQPLDTYQWLLFISAHSERHTKQILEVKADSNFPKK